jgi:hypothetical protein
LPASTSTLMGAEPATTLTLEPPAAAVANNRRTASGELKATRFSIGSQVRRMYSARLSVPDVLAMPLLCPDDVEVIPTPTRAALAAFQTCTPTRLLYASAAALRSGQARSYAEPRCWTWATRLSLMSMHTCYSSSSRFRRRCDISACVSQACSQRSTTRVAYIRLLHNVWRTCSQLCRLQGSFKIRGMVAAFAALAANQTERGVVTMSGACTWQEKLEHRVRLPAQLGMRARASRT